MLHYAYGPAQHSRVAPIAARILSSNAGERGPRANAECEKSFLYRQWKKDFSTGWRIFLVINKTWRQENDRFSPLDVCRFKAVPADVVIPNIALFCVLFLRY